MVSESERRKFFFLKENTLKCVALEGESPVTKKKKEGRVERNTLILFEERGTTLEP